MDPLMDLPTETLRRYAKIEMLEHLPMNWEDEYGTQMGRGQEQLIIFRIIATSAIVDTMEFGWWVTRLLTQDYFVGLGGLPGIKECSITGVYLCQQYGHLD